MELDQFASSTPGRTTTTTNEESATMCRQVACRECGKATWAGCGQHVDQVMRGIPKSERCAGHNDERSTGLLARLFGR